MCFYVATKMAKIHVEPDQSSIRHIILLFGAIVTPASVSVPDC